jgi:putative heme-binding domain-containing protein
MIAADPWFMGVTLRTGPDGSVFVSDWSDTGECHTYKPDTTSGRIYKITCGEVKAKAVDLAKLSDAELVELQLHRNDWYVRNARRILQERAAKADWKGEAVHKSLTGMLASSTTEPQRLRALWALHVTGGLDAGGLLTLLGDRDEHVRAWAVQLLCETETPAEKVLAKFRAMAKADPSPVVRLHLASALQRLPLAKRWDIASELVRHAADSTDANLPLMYWYAIEPLVPTDVARALELALTCEVPLVRKFVARRIADEAAAKGEKADLSPLVAALAKAESAVALDLLAGAREGLRGRKSMVMPDGWPAVYAKISKGQNAEAREHAVALALVFGDPQALADLRKVAVNPAASERERIAAIEALVEKRVADLATVLHDQLKDKVTRRAALRGLAAYSHADTPKKVLAVYAELTSEEKQDAVAALAARKEYALALLAAVEAKTVPRGDVSAFAARQIFALGDAKTTERLQQVWGEVRDTNPKKQEQMAKYKAMLTPAFMRNANTSNGRAVFSKTCQQCHKLFGEGGTIGPDLTGSNRSDMEYILSNVIDPSAEVARDYRMSVVRTLDDRVVTGIIVERTAARVVIQTATERITLSPDDVASVKDSPLSIMPEGQFDPLTKEQVRDLIAYLASKTQVPLPPAKK